MLADPEGNELCVIEAGNGFLAGTGFLGELACDGTREVGLFWSAALGWPLGWDQDEETAVQSPLGGTRSVGRSPGGREDRPEPAVVRPRGRRHGEVERLVALGATRLGAGAARRPGRQRVPASSRG